MMNAIFLAVALIAALPTFDVQTLDDKTVSGTLAELSVQGVAVDTDHSRVSLNASRLLSIVARQPRPAEGPTSVVIALMDGSIVHARQCIVQGPTAFMTMSDGTVLKLPTKSIRFIRLQPSSSADAEWARLMKTAVESDLLVVHKGTGLDYHQGILHDISADEVQFNLDGEVLPVKRSKVFGVAYRHAGEPALPAAVCRITDSSGSQWSVRSLTLSDVLQWTTPGGLALSEPLEAIAQVDFSSGKVLYLSDIQPDSTRWTPYFGGGLPAAVERFFAPRYDRGSDARRLQLGGSEYRKGLAIYSRTELVYRLPEGFGRLEAIAGIDDAVRPNGKVRLIVRGDQNVLFDAVLTGRDAPRPLDVNVMGVRRLAIVVDFAGSLGAGDCLLLCNARLSK